MIQRRIKLSHCSIIFGIQVLNIKEQKLPYQFFLRVHDGILWYTTSGKRKNPFCSSADVVGFFLLELIANAHFFFQFSQGFSDQTASTEEEILLDKNEFSVSRKRLGKTQKELAQLLGMALKTVHSYEQGWRKIPSHIERQMFFLLCKQRARHKTLTPCWEKKQCDYKLDCPAWEFQSGHLCWFISGTHCELVQGLSNEEKISKCRSCDILTSLLSE